MSSAVSSAFVIACGLGALLLFHTAALISLSQVIVIPTEPVIVEICNTP